MLLLVYLIFWAKIETIINDEIVLIIDCSDEERVLKIYIAHLFNSGMTQFSLHLPVILLS